MFILLYIISIISAISCQSICYKNARNDLNTTLKDPPIFSVPDEFKDFNNILNRIKIIYSKIRKADKLQDKLKNIGVKLNEADDKTKLMKTAEDLLTEIKENAKKMEAEKTFNMQTEKECSAAKEKYKNLTNDFKEMEKQNLKMNETFGKITSEIDKINIKSMEIQHKVNEIKIPAYLSDKYMCDKNVFKTFKDIITIANKIKKFLVDKRDKIQVNLKDLKDKLNISEMEKLPTDFSFTKKQLRHDIKFFEQRQEEVSWLKELVDEKNRLKQELEDIGKIALHLCKNGVCNLRQMIKVEN